MKYSWILLKGGFLYSLYNFCMLYTWLYNATKIECSTSVACLFILRAIGLWVQASKSQLEFKVLQYIGSFYKLIKSSLITILRNVLLITTIVMYVTWTVVGAWQVLGPSRSFCKASEIVPRHPVSDLCPWTW